MKGRKNITDGERRAIVALMRLTTLTDREVAAAVGRGLWTIFHIRKAAGIPATNKGRAAFVESPVIEEAPIDPREYWRAVEPELFRAERSDAPPAAPALSWVHPYARRAG